MILTRTPLRVSLFGGGTDYPAWFNEHGGAVLGMAINKYVYVGVKHMPVGQLHPSGKKLSFRVQYSKVEDVQNVADITHPGVQGAMRYYGLGKMDGMGKVAQRLEFHTFGDLPGRSGLGGSSSFTVGLCKALRELFTDIGSDHCSPFDELDEHSLASDAISVEQDVIKEAVGCQDQVFAAHGGINWIEFEREGRYVTPISIAGARRAELISSLVMVYTGKMRDAHAMAAAQIEAIPEKQDVFRALKHLASEGRRVLMNNVPLINIGGMLDEAWRLKKMIHPSITSPEIDELYDRGLKCGAIGGKLLGAGGGGFMLFYVPRENSDKFHANIGTDEIEYFDVAKRGSHTIIGENS